MSLETIDQYEARREKEIEIVTRIRIEKWRHSGIMCPMCRAEMQRTHGRMLNKVQIRCLECGNTEMVTHFVN